MAIRIVLYEDNPDLRESMMVLLKGTPEVEFMGAFINCEHAYDNISKLRPDVVLMDIDMPVADGLYGLRIIKENFPEVCVLMLTVFDDNEHIFEAICSGAVGYMLKRTPPGRLIEAIHDAYNGGAPMTSSIARKVLQMFPRPATATPLPDNPHNLTEREREILSSLVSGNSYKMIAAECDIRIDTVRSHIKKIYEKLHVHSQTEAVAKALKEKLV